MLQTLYNEELICSTLLSLLIFFIFAQLKLYFVTSLNCILCTVSDPYPSDQGGYQLAIWRAGSGVQCRQVKCPVQYSTVQCCRVLW